MNFERINDFVSKMEVRELGSFGNDLIQLNELMEKDQETVENIKLIDIEYIKLKEKISEFYKNINLSGNKRNEIEIIKNNFIKSELDKIIMGYYLFNQELTNNIFGYMRIVNYWYPEQFCENNYDAKQRFIRLIIKPFIEYLEEKQK